MKLTKERLMQIIKEELAELDQTANMPAIQENPVKHIATKEEAMAVIKQVEDFLFTIKLSTPGLRPIQTKIGDLKTFIQNMSG